MNKEELLKLLKTLNLPEGDYYILGGSSLVIYGLKATTGDLDLCVSYELFQTLIETYNIDLSKVNHCGFYPLNNLIEVVPNKKQELTYKIVDGLPVEDLNTILEFKKQRNAEKDRDIIPKIEEYLKSHPN